MENLNTSHIKKIQDTINKIGRKKEYGDQKNVVIYTILMEYYKSLKEDIKHEPKYFAHKDNSTSIQNPNYILLGLIREILDDLDSKLRISFYPKKVK